MAQLHQAPWLQTSHAQQIPLPRVKHTWRTLRSLIDLGNISDLFGISRASVAKASNSSQRRTSWFLNSIWSSLRPVHAQETATSSISHIKSRRVTLTSLSTFTFVNLTNPSVLEDLNRGIDPNFLLSGINDIVVPLFCKCPSNTYLKNRIQHLLTYVWQPNDEISNVSSKFNASMDDIVRENSIRVLGVQLIFLF